MDNSTNVTVSVTRHNYFIFLTTFIKNEDVSSRRVAKVIGCSTPTVKRLADGKVWPTDEMLKQSAVMFEIGIDRYGRLTKPEKEKVAKAIVVDETGVEFAAVTSAVGALGVGGAVVGAGLTAMATRIGSDLTTVLLPTPLSFMYRTIQAMMLLHKRMDPRWEMQIPYGIVPCKIENVYNRVPNSRKTQ